VAEYVGAVAQGMAFESVWQVYVCVWGGGVVGVLWRRKRQAVPTAQIMAPYLEPAGLLHMVPFTLRQVAYALCVAMQAVASR
jgi:hypothetical protein